MDPFTESVLARARQRSKMLQRIGSGLAAAPAAASAMSISTIVPGSPKGQMKRHNVLNIQQENFDMEINLASVDKCLVQVEIQEQTEGYYDGACESADLREESKSRLRKLAKLYSEDGNVEISSPIHCRTEIMTSLSAACSATEGTKISDRGRNKLAALAQNINQWNNDSPLPQQQRSNTSLTTTIPNNKQPQTRNFTSSSNIFPSISSIIHKRNEQKSPLELNDSVVNALECQGYTRENLDGKKKFLTYKFSQDKDEPAAIQAENVPKLKTCKPFMPANRLIEEEKRTPRCRPSIHAINQQKDPSALSLHERKAIFERNADNAPLLPKAAFASNCPKATLLNNKALTKNKHQATEDENGQNPRNTVAVEDKEWGGKGHKQDNSKAGIEDVAAQPVSAQNRRHQSAERNVGAHNDSCTSLHNLSACSAHVQSVLEDVREIRVRRTSHQKQQQQRLYPVLSDLEPETDRDENMDDEDDDDYDDGSLELSMNASSSSAVRADDDDCNGPTPPKCGKVHLFKSPPTKPLRHHHQVSKEEVGEEVEFVPTHVVEGDTVIPLQHTVSFYRKQQYQQQSATTRTINKITLQQQCIDEALDSILDEELLRGTTNSAANSNRDDVEKQLTAFGCEVQTQERTIAQASRALTLCNARLEFNGSTEQVEAERLLLVAAHRRQAALYDIGRLQVQLNNSTGAVADQQQRGDLTVGRITLPLKREYVRALGVAGGSGHHVVCLLKCEDTKQKVLATRHVSTAATSEQTTIDCVVDIRQQPMTLVSVRTQSTVTIEVYCLQAHDQHLPHHVKYHIKGAPSQQQQHGGGGNTVTPRKLLPSLAMITRTGRNGAAKMTKVPIESPGGPNTARSTSFALMGYAVFSVRSLLGQEQQQHCNGGSRQFTLNATPQMSPLEGSVEVREVRCVWHIPPVRRRGFLTMFEDVSGFGAWHRRWFRLDGSDLALRYWKYPDDEVEREGRVIELHSCKAGVGVVPREVCARLHTILLDQHNGAPRRYLLSADTKEERIAWCYDLNCVIGSVTT